MMPFHSSCFSFQTMKAAKSVQEIKSKVKALEKGLGFSDQMIETMNEKVDDLANSVKQAPRKFLEETVEAKPPPEGY